MVIIIYGDPGSTINDSGLISSSDVLHLEIIRDNGPVPLGADRFTVYSYSGSEMSQDVLNKIDEMSNTTENLSCINDGTTYEINITNSHGALYTYVSSNRDCGRESETIFISTGDIESLLSMLE